MTDIDPVELQKWCDEHPDYAEYCRRVREIRTELAKEEGLSYEEYMDNFEKWYKEHGIIDDIFHKTDM